MFKDIQLTVKCLMSPSIWGQSFSSPYCPEREVFETSRQPGYLCAKIYGS